MQYVIGPYVPLYRDGPTRTRKVPSVFGGFVDVVEMQDTSGAWLDVKKAPPETNWMQQQVGWQPPPGNVGSIDLRRIADQASTSYGITSDGVFAVPDGVDLGSDYEAVGEDISERRLHLADRLKLTQAPVASNRLEALREVFWLSADPSGETGPRPLMPGHNGITKLYLAGLQWSGRFDINDNRGAKSLELFRSTYRNIKAENPTLARKWLGFTERKLRLKGNEYEALQHPSDRGENDKPLKPETALSDDFSGTLSAWDTTDATGTWSISSGELRKTASSSTHQFLHYNTALSGDDHWSEVEAITAGQGNFIHGPQVRHPADATATCYIAGQYSGQYYLTKFVSGSQTNMSNVSHTYAANEVMKLQVDGSNLENFIDDASKDTHTDTAITGNLYCGVTQWEASTTTTMDNWAAEDLGGGIALPIIYHHRQRN